MSSVDASAAELADASSPGRWEQLPGWARGALPLWAGSRVAVFVATFAAARVLAGGQADKVQGTLAGWYHWDVALFIKVAQYGWFSPAYTDKTAVDFPGLPLALRLVHLIVPSWVAAGLLVSLIAGGAAAAALWQLGADEGGPRVGRLAVLLMVVSPYAVFLFAGYSEPLFFGFAVTSWLAAKRDRWPLAVLLACGATATRVTGLAFAAALAVEYLVQRHAATKASGRSPLRLLDRRAPLLVLPAVPVVLFVVHLHALSGSWTAYSDAQREGWGRTVAMPWVGWRNTWRSAFSTPQSAEYQWFWRAELLAVVIGVILLVVLLLQRRWGEATYVGASTLLMTISTAFESGIRTTLIWFPLYLLLARLAQGRPWLRAGLLWVATPLMVVFSVAFTRGVWLG
jgi:hypothetical protein